MINHDGDSADSNSGTLFGWLGEDELENSKTRRYMLIRDLEITSICLGTCYAAVGSIGYS
jgi:hypothetical protein